MKLAWEAAGATHVGRIRAGNEDSFRLDPARGVFVVADGMGGHAAGEVASELAADVVSRLAAEAVDARVAGGDLLGSLREAVLAAHGAILTRCREAPATAGMGTTLTAVAVEPSGEAHAVHVGDSRLYRFNGRDLSQVTRDHTWVQRELDTGRITAAQARKHPLSHILTNVLTDEAEPGVDSLSLVLEPGEELLLVTDGLYNMLDDHAITEVLRGDGNTAERAAELVDAANLAGGADNVTVVLVRLLSQAAGSP